MEQPINKPFKSKAKNKKYSVFVMDKGKRKLIHFGDVRYEHFKDKIGDFKHLDHGDKDRRRSYLARAKGIKDKQGNLTWKDKTSPNYWSIRFLW